jgi:hypothetical protein
MTLIHPSHPSFSPHGKYRGMLKSGDKKEKFGRALFYEIFILFNMLDQSGPSGSSLLTRLRSLMIPGPEVGEHGRPKASVTALYIYMIE